MAIRRKTSRGGDTSLSRVLEATVGVKGVSDLLRCRKSVFGPMNTDIPCVLRPYLVGQEYGILQYIPMPGDFLARPGERTVVYGFGFRPKIRKNSPARSVPPATE